MTNPTEPWKAWYIRRPESTCDALYVVPTMAAGNEGWSTTALTAVDLSQPKKIVTRILPLPTNTPK